MPALGGDRNLDLDDPRARCPDQPCNFTAHPAIAAIQTTAFSGGPAHTSWCSGGSSFALPPFVWRQLPIGSPWIPEFDQLGSCLINGIEQHITRDKFRPLIRKPAP